MTARVRWGLRAGASLTDLRGLPDKVSLARPIRQQWEAPVYTERTSVGLDVHARSVAAEAIDGAAGELVQARLTPDHGHIRSWIHDLPGPVAVAYEAGPTGFGLARSLNTDRIRCVVAAPSKLQRPSGDRVKTDARDAVHLARLLRLDEVAAVTVPGVEQEAARDLVRAREDCRGDLMRARHRVSKLLLRHGIVYTRGAAWTGAHHAWLARQHLPNPATRMAFDAEHEAVLATLALRDRLDAAITAMAADSQFTPVVHRLCCLRGISTLTGFGLAVEIGDWDRFTGNTIGAFFGLVPSEHSSGSSRSQGPSPRLATPMPAACSWRLPGTTGPPTGSGSPCAPAGTTPRPPLGSAGTPATAGCTSAGCGCSSARSAPRPPMWPSPGNLPGGAGRWPSWTASWTRSLPDRPGPTSRPVGVPGRQRVERSAIHL